MPKIKIRPNGETMEFVDELEMSLDVPRESAVRFAKAILEADRTGDHVEVEVKE